MDEAEFRKKQIERDKESLEKRIRRWKKLVPATYNVNLPNLVWYYLTESDEMYISGHFLGAILLCAGIAEIIIADQIKINLMLSTRETERFGLEQLTILGQRINILDELESKQLHDLRKLRNILIHANTGKLGKMARKIYDPSSSDDYLYMGFYLTPISNGGIDIDRDALQYLQIIRNLTIKFYGAEP